MFMLRKLVHYCQKRNNSSASFTKTFSKWQDRLITPSSESHQIVYDPNLYWNGSTAIKKAGVLIPFCSVHGNPSVLFTIRSHNLRNHSGEISFPGGLREKKDESIIQTAIRETQEEIGIQPLTILGTHFTVPDKTLKVAVTPVVGWLGPVNLSQLSYQPNEVANVFSVNLTQFKNLNHVQMKYYYPTGNEKYKIGMPEWTIVPDDASIPIRAPVRIWGLTARILYNFLKKVYLD